MPKRRWLPVLLVMLVGLAACGRKTDDGTAWQTPSVPPTVTPTAVEPTPEGLFVSELPAPSNGGLILPELVGVDGGLLIARGGNLWLTWFGGAEPVLIAEGIAPAMIELSPDGRSIVYAMGVTREEEANNGGPVQRFEYRLTMTHLDALDQVDLIAVGSRRRMHGALLGWSPDGQTVLTWKSSAIIASSADGLNVQAWAGLPSVAWLADSRALIIAPEDLIVQNAPLAVFRVDSRTGVRTDMRITPEDSPDLLRLTEILAARGLVFDPTAYHDFHRAAPLPDGSWAYIDWSDAVKQMNAPLCATWEVRRTGSDEPLLVSPDTTFLSDLRALPDGSLLFLKWTLSGCRFLGGMRVELLRLVPGEEPEIITGEIDPGNEGNPNLVNSLGYWRARKYTVTADGRFVFWIGKGDVEGVSLIHVTDLEEQIAAPLLADVVMPDGAGQFEGVYWVPLPADEGQE